MKEFIIGLKEGQKRFGETIAIIINSILLSLVYFIGVGLTSIFGKLIGKKFLDMNKKSNTYWEDLNLKGGSLSKAYRQF